MKRDAFSNCHPAVIFLFFLGAIAIGVVVTHPAYLIAGCVGAALYYLLLVGKAGIRNIAALLPFFSLITFINPFINTRGRHILFSVFGRNYTLEALCYGAAIGMMFVLMILWFLCYSLVMTSEKFTSLFGNLLPSISLLLVMVLRLIPALSRKEKQIANARALIGKSPRESDSIKEKIRNGTGILSALTDHALEGSIITGDSMKSRGYGTGKRTNFNIYHMTAHDWILTVLMSTLLLGVVSFGGTKVMFTPVMRIPMVGCGFYLYCIFLLLPSILHIKETVLWHISISRI